MYSTLFHIGIFFKYYSLLDWCKGYKKQSRFKRSSVQGKNRAAVSTAGNGDNAYTTALHWWCRYIPLRWEESWKTLFDKFLKITPKALRFIHLQLMAILPTLRYQWYGEAILIEISPKKTGYRKAFTSCVKDLCRKNRKICLISMSLQKTN